MQKARGELIEATRSLQELPTGHKQFVMEKTIKGASMALAVIIYTADS